MTRAIAVTTVCVLFAWGAIAILGRSVIPAYLAAWLTFLALPAGALPIVLGMELAGLGNAAQCGFLRRFLILMPAAALAGLPVLTAAGGLYPWVAHPPVGFAGAWFSQPWFALRGIAYLTVWTLLALSSVRPASGEARVRLCISGIATHTVVATLAAIDWVMSLSPGLNSAAFGLLLIVIQSALAVSAAVLVCRARPPGIVALLLTTSGIWATLHIVQYLVVWSADKPDEVIYYLHRRNLAGESIVWFGCGALVISVLLLGVARLGSLSSVLVGCAFFLFTAHLAEMVWLVIPSARGSFSLSSVDVSAWLFFAALASAITWSWLPTQVRA